MINLSSTSVCSSNLKHGLYGLKIKRLNFNACVALFLCKKKKGVVIYCQIIVLAQGTAREPNAALKLIGHTSADMIKNVE